MHLSAIFDYKINGQGFGALSHIDRKSVDFVLCDKVTLKPLLAIELDDWSHELNTRKARDLIVNQIFIHANFPLWRTGEIPSREEVSQNVDKYLKV